jgi:S1-C subfamily serine protease
MTTLPLARSALLLGFCLPFGAQSLLSQRTPPPPPPRPAPAPRPKIYLNGMTMASGGLLGITLRTSSGPADTLGILVESVQDDLPAAKAGITEGARIAAIDGIDLRLEPRDIGDSAAERLPESRLRRAIAAKAPGESVALEIRQDGRTQSKRVTLAESPGARVFAASSQSARRVLGVGFAQRGSIRDTAGLLITSLTDSGAAETAGLMEGDRVVSIDGIDLRVPAADAGSPEGVEARIARLRRTLDAARDSQPVRLEVLSDGRRRTFSVTPRKATGWGWSISPGQMQDLASDMRASLDRNMAESQRELARSRIEIERTTRDDDADDSDMRSTRRDDARRPGGMLRGRTDGATLSLDGLSLASVDRDFGQQFGKGAERGALVVRVRNEWEPLRAGDVILTIEGRSVRDGNSLDVTIDRSRDQRIEILRNGRQQTITLRPSR